MQFLWHKKKSEWSMFQFYLFLLKFKKISWNTQPTRYMYGLINCEFYVSGLHLSPPLFSLLTSYMSWHVDMLTCWHSWLETLGLSSLEVFAVMLCTRIFMHFNQIGLFACKKEKTNISNRFRRKIIWQRLHLI